MLAWLGDARAMTTSDLPEHEPEPEPVVFGTGASLKQGEVEPGPAPMSWVTPDDEDPAT